MGIVGGNTWERIHGVAKEVVHPTNREYKELPKFIEACEKAGVTPTSRQASKYRNKKGSAYTGKK